MIGKGTPEELFRLLGRTPKKPHSSLYPHPRTVVELVDTSGHDLIHKPRQFRIDGSPVLVAQDGIELDFSDKTATTVTFRLLVSEVHFVSEKQANRNRWIRRLRKLVRR